MSPIGSDARRGFTLIELMLVLVVVAILATATVPRLQESMRRLRAEQVTAELMNLMRAAREQAIAAQAETQWSWDAANRRAVVDLAAAEEDDEAAGESPPSVNRLTGARAPEGVTVTVSRQGDPVECACLRFFPDGTSEPGQLSIHLFEHTLTARLDETTGQAALLSPGSAAR